MEPISLVEIINNVGFPIACVIAMFYMMIKEREAHKEETEKMTEALNNNTLVLESIKAILHERGADL